MRKIRMIGLDLDGTVLTNDKKVTENTKKTIARAIEEGIVVVPVTGRPLPGIPQELKEIPGMRYAVTSNGARTFDGRRELFGFYLDPDIAASDVRLCMKQNYLYSVFVNGIGCSDRKTHEALLSRFAGTPLYTYMQASRKPADDILALIRDPSTRIENVWLRTPGKAEADAAERSIQSAASGRAQTLRTLPMDVEAVDKNADKGTALRKLGDMLGIRREEIMAVGDSENDIGLLKQAGVSVAMGNAPEKIRLLCQYVTADNEHEGCAEAIRRLALGEETT